MPVCVSAGECLCGLRVREAVCRSFCVHGCKGVPLCPCVHLCVGMTDCAPKWMYACACVPVCEPLCVMCLCPECMCVSWRVCFENIRVYECECVLACVSECVSVCASVSVCVYV